MRRLLLCMAVLGGSAVPGAVFAKKPPRGPRSVVLEVVSATGAGQTRTAQFTLALARPQACASARDHGGEEQVDVEVCVDEREPRGGPPLLSLDLARSLSTPRGPRRTHQRIKVRARIAPDKRVLIGRLQTVRAHSTEVYATLR